MSEIWSLAAVSYDRFRGIHSPLDNQKRTTNAQVIRYYLNQSPIALIFNMMEIHMYIIFYFLTRYYKQANLIILLIWIVSIVLSIFPLVGWSQYVSEVNNEYVR
jgi:hypothetical protein